RALTAPHRALTAPHRALTAPHRALTAPHRALTAPHRALILHLWCRQIRIFAECRGTTTARSAKAG
ncbi:hypothetical protein, partial [Dactylosporangium sp. NPDC051484]|uniref:hypothetical protein n=1 Tax=Dactylosporangium sp. NPDC051484 TaxID=3154942 RepID=UPI00344C3F01